MLKTPLSFISDAAQIPQSDPELIIIRMPEVERITGLCRPTIYKRLKDDLTFPKPVALSDSTARGAPIGFVLAEVQQWVRSRIAARGQTHQLPRDTGSALDQCEV